MSKFQGHPINHDHYRAQRTCSNFYPPRGIDKDVMIGRISLALTILLLVIAAVWGGV